MAKVISSSHLVIFFICYILHNVRCVEQILDDQTNSITKQTSINEDLDWKLRNVSNFHFTKVPGIAINDSKLSIFHRSIVNWDRYSFDANEIYMHQNEPIIVDPILTFNLAGDFISSWGKNHFFMPHGLSFDFQGNVWLTDVALHQVFKFNGQNLSQPVLVLGERFVPGFDERHFCKPTDVQVSAKAKLVYISDGYCNKRVITFDLNGNFVKQFGIQQDMLVPHSLSLIEQLDLICVADRERGRVLCFDAGIKDHMQLGQLKKKLYLGPQTHIYAIQNIGTHLFGVMLVDNSVQAHAFLFDLSKDSNELVWQNELALSMPHDLALDENNNLYVAEIGENQSKLVKKFKTNNMVQLFGEKSTNLSRFEEHHSKSKRIDDTRRQEEDLKSLINTEKQITSKENENVITTTSVTTSNPAQQNSESDIRSKQSSLLFLILLITLLIFISIILFALKKRIGIENYFRSRGLPTKVMYSKDLHINDPERCGFNLLREEEENLYDFELENGNSSESEVEEFNFKHVRKV